MSNIWDSFQVPSDDQPLEGGQCILQFGTERKVINLEDPEAPRTVGEAFQRYAQDLGTSAEGEVRFRALSGALNADSTLEPGVTYVASVTSDRHGR